MTQIRLWRCQRFSASKHGLSTWNWNACPDRSILAHAVLRIFAQQTRTIRQASHQKERLSLSTCCWILMWEDASSRRFHDGKGTSRCRILCFAKYWWHLYEVCILMMALVRVCQAAPVRQLHSSTAPGHGVQKMVPVFSESINCDSSVFFQQFLVVNWCSLGV